MRKLILHIIFVFLTIAVLLNPATADTVNLLSSASNTASGSGSSGMPAITSLNIPTGNNRALVIFAAFERDHCDKTTDDCTLGNTGSSGDLSDNFTSSSYSSNEITARVSGVGGNIDKKNAMTIGGSPSGDMRFSRLVHYVVGFEPTTVFFSASSYHIALFESDIDTLLAGNASGNVSITLPGAATPKSAGDDAILTAFIFDNVDQTPAGIVRANLASINNMTTGMPGNFTIPSVPFDVGDEPTHADDGLLLVGGSTIGLPTDSGGYDTVSGFSEILELSTNNSNGIYEVSDPHNATAEPDGMSVSAQFRNGIINTYTMQSSAPSSISASAGWSALFRLKAHISTTPSIPHTCYAVADEGDRFFSYDSTTNVWTNIGNVGVTDIEAIAYDPTTNTLYAANDKDFGVINTTTGTFSSLNNNLSDIFGTLGNYSIQDIDSLSVDPFSGLIWAVDRRGEHRDSSWKYDQVPPGNNDIVFKIDPATNDVVKDAFGPGIDYVFAEEVQDPNLDNNVVINAAANNNHVWDVDDIAVDPVNGDIYVISNLGGTGGMLTKLNPMNGSVEQIVANFTYNGTAVDDIEGLGFYNDGQLYGTTGNDENFSDTSLRNRLFLIDKTTGQMTLQASIDPSGTNRDIEAVDCYTGQPNIISGTVFNDVDGNQTQDAAENGTASVTVEIYLDKDASNTVTAADSLVKTTQTDINGDYSFNMPSTGSFVIQVLPATLIAGHSLTTDNVETAAFNDVGLTDTNNNFGHQLSGSTINYCGVELTNYLALDFNQTPTLESGTANTTGAVYRFSSVATDIDGLVTVDYLKANENINLMDGEFKGQLRDTSNARFDYSVSLVKTGTSTPIDNPIDIVITSSDVDGSSGNMVQDFGIFKDPNFTILDTPTKLIHSSNSNEEKFTTLPAYVGMQASSSTTMDFRATAIYIGVKSFQIAGGFENANKSSNRTVSFKLDKSKLKDYNTLNCIQHNNLPSDYGDAPTSGTAPDGISNNAYGNTSHRLNSNLYLGNSQPDNDASHQAGNEADGDDTNGMDDEDGISSFPSLSAGDASYTIPTTNITASGDGTLHAWIDFNGDGVFSNTEYASTTITAGTVTTDLSWIGQSTLTGTHTFARFRLSSDAAITASTPSGAASDGEVEDYKIAISGSAGSCSIDDLNPSNYIGLATASNGLQLGDAALLYRSGFLREDWKGNVFAYDLKTADKSGEVKSQKWDAASRMSRSGRSLYSYDPLKTGSRGINFSWDQLNAEQQQILQNGGDATVGQKRLAWITGSDADESTNGLFRSRNHLLGDIVHANLAFNSNVANYGYKQLGGSEGSAYATYLSSKLNSKEALFVGSNDGMLHAFDAANGDELFAYVPDALLSKIVTVSNPLYGCTQSGCLSHEYLVDGQSSLGDAYFDSSWHTVLLGTLGLGGKALFALDVSDPDNFDHNDVLWEISASQAPDNSAIYASHLGNTQTLASVIRLNNGQWAAVFANGYDSESQQAVLFLVDIQTGELIKTMNTLSGSADVPNGLSTPTAVDSNLDYIADRVYAGDLQGNVWVFDISSDNPDEWGVAYGTSEQPLPLFTACDDSNCGNHQPITAPPQVGRHPGGGLMVYVGTGKYFDVDDNFSTGTPLTNSFYGLQDNNAPITSKSALQQQRILAEINVDTDLKARVNSNNALDYTTQKGWYMDLLKPPADSAEGERVISQAILRGGRIIFTTMIPELNVCSWDGSSWLMEFNALDGKRLTTIPFDLNDDQVFNNDDKVTYNEEKVIISGVQNTAMAMAATSPTIISHSTQTEGKYQSDSMGNLNMFRESSAHYSGRMSWRKIK